MTCRIIRARGEPFLYEEYTDKRGFCLHGNFLPETYFTICKKPIWAKLLRKQYQYSNSLPLFRQCDARQVDSSASTEALLINVLLPSGQCIRIGNCLMPLRVE